MKRAFLYLFVLAGLIIPCHLHASDIALIGNIPTDSLIDSIALSPDTDTAFGIDKEKKCLYIIDVNSHLVTKRVSLGRRPVGIAVNPSNNLAYITLKSNGFYNKKGSLCMVDSGGSVLNTYSIHGSPHGIAVNPVNNTVIIALEKEKKLLVFSADTMQPLQEIRLPFKPRLVALDEDSNRAVVTAGQGHWSWWQHIIMVVDLNTGTVTNTIKFRRGIKGIAVDTGKDIAVSTGLKEINLFDINTGSILSTVKDGDNIFSRLKLKGCSGNPKPDDKDFEDDDEIDADIGRFLDRYLPEIDEAIVEDLKGAGAGLSAFQADHTYGLDINQSTHIAVISGEESLLLLDMNTNTLNEYPLDDIKHLRAVAVDRYRNISLVSYLKHKHHRKQDAGVLEIQLPNPVPEITGLTPSFATAGDPDTALRVSGERFITSSSVLFGLYTLNPLFADNNTLDTTVPSALISKAGIYPVTVTNPIPSGGTSNSSGFTVNNPVPLISTIDPSQAMAGTQGLIVNVFGTGFADDTTVFIKGIERSYTPVSRTKLTVSLTPADLQTGGYIEIKASNPAPGGGNSNKAIFTIKPSLEITITSPANEETINKAKTIVKGTIKSETKDVGIKVDGILAEIKGNEWIANNIPLTIGANTIAATATDSQGNTDTKTITINTNDITQKVELSANITSGIAPLTTYFSASTSFIPVSYQMDYEGDEVVDYTGTIFENISHIYTSEGIFYPTITVTDNQGNTYSDTIAITVMNKAEIDTLLREKWEGMKTALANQNIAQALNYHLDEARQLYSDIYTAFFDQLPQHAQEMQDIQLVYAKNNTAKYRLRENELYGGSMETISYYIYFVIDKDGLWKIYRY
jgi:DNA-binding beta-propeller fold protein YncE